MLQAILYFVLGFLSAALIALMVSPAIWNRAVVLTKRRIEASVPLTLNEIQADKDQLRAEFAMSTRRLEMSVEELREKAARQVIEISRKRDELAKLAEEGRERVKSIGDLEARSSELRTQLREREERLATTNKRLDETRARLEEKSLELEKLRDRMTEVQTEADSRRIELVARQTALESATDNLEEFRQRERELKVELAALKEQHERATVDLERERDRASELNRKVNRLERQLSDREENLDSRERELARIRETGEAEGREAAELHSRILELRASNVELEAKLAQSALQMEALLNDASNDNVEKAMASLNRDKERIEAELAAISAERDALKTEVSRYRKHESEDWAVERRENAILRERINDLAAQVTAMTSALEGDRGAIDIALAQAPRFTPPQPAAEEAAPAAPSLADRIRALQQAARANRAG